MVFSSYLFLFYFLPLSLALYYAAPRRLKHFVLTVLSYIFYGWANPLFVVLLLISTLIDYIGGIQIERANDLRGKRRWLAVSLTSNLSLLGFFKYYNFGVDNLNALARATGLDILGVDSALRVTLPLGISFYTFQSMSYAWDVYRGRTAALYNFIDYACFVSMFPQLVAGPIIRFSEVADQLRTRTHTITKFARGIAFFSVGLAKKVLLANPCGKIADLAFDAGSLHPLDAWYGVTAYAFQIYFDFSGYSDMAIGLGLMFGFVFAKNFDSPYLSQSITEFWRRWHISLSTWLRDYLYVPLGGNRGTEARTYVNLMLTMLLGGLWHGASWTFVAWGGLHGLYLAGERWVRAKTGVTGDPAGLLNRLALALLTYTLVNVTWVFFRAESFGGAARILEGMAGLAPDAKPVLATTFVAKVVVIVTAIVVTQWLMRKRSLEDLVARTPWWVTAVVCAAMLFAVTITQGSGQAFIYFQF
jgi:alginate O-acetyltransferase complex protein AlgI